jgi:GTP-binding protein
MPGQPGQHRSILLELKLIADVGLVGFPNAGKSTLLHALSNARPKIAAYPFTTLHPSVGVVEYTDMERVTVADIPGLIDGASENRGLGHAFLKHVERTKVLLFVVDGPGTEGRCPTADLKSLFKELELYNPDLLKKPSLIFANKADTLGKSCTEKDLSTHPLSKLAKKKGIDVIWGSAKEGMSLAELTRKLRLILTCV